MTDKTLIARVREGRARVSLRGSDGQTGVEPFSRDRKRIEVKGYALTENGESITDGEATGFLLVLPVMAGNTPLVAITIAGGDKQASLVVDTDGLALIMNHLLEAMKIVTIELEQGKD